MQNVFCGGKLSDRRMDIKAFAVMVVCICLITVDRKHWKQGNKLQALAQYIFQGQFNTQYNLAFASYLLVLLPVLIFYVICQKWIISGVVTGAVKQ